MIIKNLRLEHGYSQEQLSTLCNLSTRTIQRIEKDDIASLSSLNTLAKVFNLDINELQAKLKNKDKLNNDIKTDKKYNFFDYKTIRFIIINLFLFLINIFTSPNNLWFFYVLFGWGIFFLLKKYKSYNS